MATELTWLGHSAFRIDLVLLTHGHDDHLGDTVAIARTFECPVVALRELVPSGVGILEPAPGETLTF